MKDIIKDIIDKNKFNKLLPQEYLRFLERRILPEYKKYDELSLQHQTNFKLWGSIVFIASFLSVLIIGIGISFYEQIPKSFYLIELSFLLFILIAYLVTNRSGYHSKWIEYRLKAEQLRINIFSILATKPHIFFESVDNDHQNLKNIQNEVQLGEIDKLKEYLIEYWLETQKEYHSNKLKNYHKKEKIIKNSIRVTYILAIIVSILHFFLNSHLYENILILFVLILPAFGATLVGIKSHRDFSSISLNSKRMVNGIDEFINDIRKSKNYQELFKIIKKVEWFFANELERWDTIIRSRELELAI